MKGKIVFSAFAALVGAFAAAEMKASRGRPDGEPDYLLILGNTVHGEEPSEILKTRIAAAAEYLLAHPSVIAIPCGGIVQKDQTKAEAAVIAERLIAAGVGPERIIQEDRSKTTRENFINASKIIAASGKESPKVAFLSSEHHLLRAGFIAKTVGMRAGSVPAQTPGNELAKAYLREFAVFPLLAFEIMKGKIGPEKNGG